MSPVHDSSDLPSGAALPSMPRVGIRRLPRVVLAMFVGVMMVVLASCVSQQSSPSWGTNTGSTVDVYATARIGNLLIVGGNFSSVVSPDGLQQHAAGGLAALDAVTGNWVWSASAGGTVYRLVSDGTSIWAGGAFGLKRFSTSGADLGFKAPYAVGTVHGIVVSGAHVYYGGTTAIAAAATSGAGVWKVPVDGQVYAMSVAQSGTRLLAGGYFCNINGIHRPGLASMNLNGIVDTSFSATSFGCGAFVSARSVLDMAVSGNVAYIAGGGSLNRLLAVSTSSGRLQWSTPRGDGDVQSVAVVPQDNVIYIGGHFNCVSGTVKPCVSVRQKAAEYTMTGLLVSTWKPNISGGLWGVYSLTADTKGVYAGGNFTTVNGLQRHKIAIFH